LCPATTKFSNVYFGLRLLIFFLGKYEEIRSTVSVFAVVISRRGCFERSLIISCCDSSFFASIGVLTWKSIWITEGKYFETASFSSDL
jgi:hypothetical protein